MITRLLHQPSPPLLQLKDVNFIISINVCNAKVEWEEPDEDSTNDPDEEEGDESVWEDIEVEEVPNLDWGWNEILF